MATIHIIEDDNDLLAILHAYFTAKGFTVLDDFNGEKFSAGTASIADVYLVDIALINKSGFDISRKIKSGLLQKPVILMSANFHKQSVIDASAADGFIEKPFELNEMARQIWSMLPSEQ